MVKKVSKKSRGNTCYGVLCQYVCRLEPATYLGKGLHRRCFSVSFVIYSGKLFYKKLANDRFHNCSKGYIYIWRKQHQKWIPSQSGSFSIILPQLNLTDGFRYWRSYCQLMIKYGCIAGVRRYWWISYITLSIILSINRDQVFVFAMFTVFVRYT